MDKEKTLLVVGVPGIVHGVIKRVAADRGVRMRDLLLEILGEWAKRQGGKR